MGGAGSFASPWRNEVDGFHDLGRLIGAMCVIVGLEDQMMDMRVEAVVEMARTWPAGDQAGLLDALLFGYWRGRLDGK
ncbi:MAG: hypothetical protein RugAbin2_00199 [Rugosibacter sp.]|nr:hypothetical protein [Rugosibacter sp.]